MGQQQSKDELLYQQVNYGNIEGIKALCREGAGLEWIDKEAKTPLIVACMNPELISVAKTLIELGANVNAFRPGGHAGTPLHHAAKRGLEQTVKLLLSHGANAFVMNDDCQTPLEVARTKGYINVVRTIESHVGFFSGWLRELHGPGFLEAFAPQLLSKKVWVVVLPFGSPNSSKPLRLGIFIYPSMQVAMPRNVIALWKATIEEPKFHQPDPVLIVFDNQTKTRYKFASENEGDKQQLRSFYAACRGEPQVMHLPALPNIESPTIPASAPTFTSQDTRFGISSKACAEEPTQELNQGWSISEAGPSNSTSQTMTLADAGTASIPSAPPLPEGAVDDPLHYPSIDLSPVDLPIPTVQHGQGGASEGRDGDATSSCVICLDAPIEGACIPCGHMAGCMSCLNEIKSKKWGCPVCRSKINQVIRLYAV